MTSSGEQDYVGMPLGRSANGTLSIESILYAATACNEEVRQLLRGECNAILECKICRELFRSMSSFIKHKYSDCKALFKERQERLEGSLTPAECMSLRELCIEGANRCASPDSCRSSEGSDCAVTSGPKNATTSQTALERIAGNGNAVYQTISTSSQDHAGTMLDSEPEECPYVKRQMSTLGAVDCQLPAVPSRVTPSTKGLMHYGQLRSHSGKRKNANPVSITVAQRNGVSVHEAVVAQGNSAAMQEQRGSRDSSPRPQAGTTTTNGRMDSTVAASALKRSPHWRSIHDLATLSCTGCKVNFANIKDLHHHMVIFHTIKKVFYRCFCCPSVFSQQWGVKRHMKRAHGKSKEEIEAVLSQLKKTPCTNLGSATALKLSQVSSSRLAAALSRVSAQREGRSAASDSSATRQSSTLPGSPTGLLCASPDVSTMLAKKKKLDLHACSVCSKVFGSSALMRKHQELCSGAIPSSSSLASSAEVAGIAVPSTSEAVSLANRMPNGKEQSSALPIAEEARAAGASHDAAAVALPQLVKSSSTAPVSPSSLSSLAVCRSRRPPKPNRLFLDTSAGQKSNPEIIPLSLFKRRLGLHKRAKKASFVATLEAASRSPVFCASGDLAKKIDAKEKGPANLLPDAPAASNDSVLGGTSADQGVVQGGATLAKSVAPRKKSPTSSMASVPAMDEMEGVVDVGNLICLICQKQFSTTFNLRRHARRHSRKKRFKCIQCGYTSHDRSDCSVHVRKRHMAADSLLRPTLETYIVDLGDRPVTPPSQSSYGPAVESEADSSC